MCSFGILRPYLISRALLRGMATMARLKAEILAELGGKFPKHIYH